MNLLRLSATRRPEQHILLFRRPLGTNPRTGLVDPEKARVTREQYRKQYEELCEPPKVQETPADAAALKATTAETGTTTSDPAAATESIAKPEVTAAPADADQM